MNQRDTGAKYETVAADYLRKKGHRILAMNYRIRSGEIDLITKEENYLVFHEVKYRTGSERGTGAEAVNKKKQKNIIKTAQHYLLVHGYAEDTPCRFDVIDIMNDAITHIENAFEVEG